MKQFQLLKPYVMERRFSILAGLLSLLIVDALQLFIPRIIKWAVDDIALLSPEGANLFRYCVYILVSALIIGLFRFSWRFCIMGTARRVEEGIREELFTHVQKLPATFFDKKTAGDIMAHSTNDITNIRMAIGMGLVGLTDTVVLGIAAIGFMGFISIKLTLLALAPMPLIALFTKVLSKKLFAAYMLVQESFSRLMESTRERFAGIRVIKAFNREHHETRAMETESLEYISANLRLIKLRGLIFPLIIFLTSISQAILLGAGGRGVILNTISPGDFVAFISYLGLLTWPVMAVGWVANLIQRGKASVDRISAILETPPAITDPDNPIEPETVSGEIEFRDVSFAYNENGASPPVLNRIRLRIRPGQMLGIAGPPGSGKTTLVNLIPRIYDPRSGEIRMDGIDHRKLRLDTLRRAITVVPQEPFLFSGTLLENLRFGNPSAGMADIDTAIAMASLTRTIEGFPRGIETVIGEKGVMLSGGQKQRIALARAFLKQSPVMILDDPISQVDMQTASDITSFIESLAGQRTIIIISHRFAVFRNADQVIVMENGTVAAQGTHAELVETNSYYARANAMQAADTFAGRKTP